MAFASMTGIIYSDKYTDLCRVCGLHDNYRIVTTGTNFSDSCN